MTKIFNVSRRKVGGIWFVKLGRVNISFCVSRPKSIIEVQRIEYTTLAAARNMNRVERALRLRDIEIRARGCEFEVHHDA